MSTKNTIYWLRDNLHIYDECFDEDNIVYLDIRVDNGVASSNTSVRLPPEAVKAIAEYHAKREAEGDVDE